MHRHKALWIGIAAGISVGLYLLVSHSTYWIGFPLDDAWIHQTYARNLAKFGEWAFVHGQRSGGSTSPMWSAILAVGYLARLGPYLWTFLIGWLVLWGLSLVCASIFETLCPEGEVYGVWVGVFVALEWHLAWHAVSGMETLLFALVVTQTLRLLLKPVKNKGDAVMLGALSGVSVWLRPDGLTLLGPVMFVLFSNQVNRHKKWLNMLVVACGFLVVFLPYLGFNQVISGDWWPTTFYAKQAEYAFLREGSLVLRFLQQFWTLLIGPGLVLLPAVIYLTVKAVVKKDWPVIGVFMWFMGYLGLYAWRLPVVYQHGRYIAAAIPVFLTLGLAGMYKWVGSDKRGKNRWVIETSWKAALVLVTLGMWVQGARAYGQDVAFIETEMVTVARWLANNTSENDLIAVHDIGAMGYYSDRALIDLAGLISPEVIPFMRDEVKLGAYLDEKGADFLVTFPGWYPELVQGRDVVYRTDGKVGPALGGENMVVYRWGGR